jgi:hypothetical protein
MNASVAIHSRTHTLYAKLLFQLMDGGCNNRSFPEEKAMASQNQIDAETIEDYQRDGAVCIRGALKDWVDTIAAGIERNIQNRSATASDIANGHGSFFDDYCNWEPSRNSREWCGNRQPQHWRRR